MVVQQNGTVELISMEDEQPAETEALDQVGDVVEVDEGIEDSEGVTLHSIKDQEVLSMIEIANESEQAQHGAQMIEMPFEHAEVVNIQQALENNGVLFSDIDIDMDTVSSKFSSELL